MAERTTLWGVVASVVILIGFGTLVVFQMMTPSHLDLAVGGDWWVRQWSSMAGSSSSVELWHGKTGDRAPHEMVVHTYRYYGDDCIAYSATVGSVVRYFFACGSRTPLPLGPDSEADWQFEADALQQRGVENSATAFAAGKRRLLVAELKRELQARP